MVLEIYARIDSRILYMIPEPESLAHEISTTFARYLQEETSVNSDEVRTIHLDTLTEAGRRTTEEVLDDFQSGYLDIQVYVPSPTQIVVHIKAKDDSIHPETSRTLN